MAHARVEGGVVVEGPCGLPAHYAGISGFHNLTNVELSAHGWLPVDFAGLDYDDRYEVRTGPTLSVVKGRVKAVYTVTPRPLSAVRAELKAEAARLRWERETGGREVNGVRFETDDRSKALINGAVLRAQLDPNVQIRFKTGAGEVTLNAADMIAVGLAVAAHVQACFDRELDLIASIDGAGSVQELAAISLSFP